MSSLSIAVAITLSAAGVLAVAPAPVRAASPEYRADAPKHAPKLRLRIAVAPFAWDNTNPQIAALPSNVRDNIQAALIKKLSDCGRFEVMDNDAGAIAPSGADKHTEDPNPEDAPAPPSQKSTAAPFVILPKVTGFQAASDGLGGQRSGIFQFGSRTTRLTMSLRIRIADAQTGETIGAEDAQSELLSKDEGFQIDAALASYGNDPKSNSTIAKIVDTTMDDATKNIINRLNDKPWSALVATIDMMTNRVVINAGANAGVSEGLVFDVFRTSGEVRDPKSGEILSKGDEVKVGQIKVSKVQNRVAFCDVVEGQDFKPTDIVRISN